MILIETFHLSEPRTFVVFGRYVERVFGSIYVSLLLKSNKNDVCGAVTLQIYPMPQQRLTTSWRDTDVLSFLLHICRLLFDNIKQDNRET